MGVVVKLCGGKSCAAHLVPDKRSFGETFLTTVLAIWNFFLNFLPYSHICIVLGGFQRKLSKRGKTEEGLWVTSKTMEALSHWFVQFNR